MIYQSVEEIYAALDNTRARLSRRVANLSNAQENYKPEEGIWSVAEIVEHLSAIEEQLLQLFRMMIRRAEAGGASTNGVNFRPVTLERFVEQSRGMKFQAPEQARPRGGVRVSDSLAKMAGTRESLRELQGQAEQLDLCAQARPHPAFGPLNFYEWLAFIGLHEERHLRQIEGLINSPEFPA